MTIVSCSWGVLVATPKRIAVVSDGLNALRVEHFIPVIEKIKIVRGRHVTEQTPLLGEYILTSICSRWRLLLGIKGVRGIILNELGYPAQVLPRELDRLRSMCDGVVFREVKIAPVEFEYGQKVMVKEGPFISHIGKYDHKAKDGDVALFVLFGREQKLKFATGDLIAV